MQPFKRKEYTQKEKAKYIKKCGIPRKVSYVMAYNGRRTPNWGMAHKNKVKAH